MRERKAPRSVTPIGDNLLDRLKLFGSFGLWDYAVILEIAFALKSEEVNGVTVVGGAQLVPWAALVNRPTTS